MKIQRGGRGCTEFQEFAVYLAAFADVPARQRRQRKREGRNEAKRVALFGAQEGGGKDEAGRKKREKTVRGDCSSGCANCTVGQVSAGKMIFKRPERGGLEESDEANGHVTDRPSLRFFPER